MPTKHAVHRVLMLHAYMVVVDVLGGLIALNLRLLLGFRLVCGSCFGLGGGLVVLLLGSRRG